MSLKTILSIITGGIIIGSLFSLQYEVVPHEWLRLGTSSIFFFFALRIFNARNYYGWIIFFLLVFCDLLFLFWEHSFSKPGYYVSHIGAIAILVFLTVRELHWPKISKIEIFSILFFFLINSLILLFLGTYFNSGIENVGLRILFYMNGFLILMMVLSAFLYSIHFANDVSAFLFLAVIGLTLSDLLLFGIYFVNLQEFSFIDSALYSLGLYFLIRSYLEHRKISKSKTEESTSELKKGKETEKSQEIYK